jgi:hypothetical protein
MGEVRGMKMKTWIFAILLFGMVSAGNIPAATFIGYTPTQISSTINLTYLNTYYSPEIMGASVFFVFKYNKIQHSDDYNGEKFGATTIPTIARFSVKYNVILNCLTSNSALGCYNQLINGTTVQNISMGATQTTMTPIRLQIQRFLGAELMRGQRLQTTLRDETNFNNAIGIDWIKTMIMRERV